MIIFLHKIKMQLSFIYFILQTKKINFYQMKTQQKSLIHLHKSHQFQKPLFKYNSTPNPKSKSVTKKNATESEYKNFIEGFSTPQTFNELRSISNVFTQKQFSKVSLFESVKKSKGEFYFKTIYQKSKYMEIEPQSDLSQWLSQRKYFVYVISGHLNLYKRAESDEIKDSDDINLSIKSPSKYKNRQSNFSKCYLRSYVTNQHFGYQQYPLYWKEKLIFQASTLTKVLLFPLESFYKAFSNVINLSAIQLTAQFLKKISVFKQIEMEKLLRLSTFCQRIRTYPNTIIVKKNDLIENLILLYEGRVSLPNDSGRYNEEKSGWLIGKKQIDSRMTHFDQDVHSLIQCDLVLIPLKEFSKVSQIKLKLRQSCLDENERNVKSRKKMSSNLSVNDKNRRYSVKGYQTMEQQIFNKNVSMDSFKLNKANTFQIENTYQGKSQRNIKYRPKTAFQGLNASQDSSKSVVYTRNGRHFIMDRAKTQSSQKRPISTILNISQSENKINERKDFDSKQKLENVTIGEIYWTKFLNRKLQLENKEISKIINARLPESILNQGKQYAVLKPLVQKKSTYIKNFKRKIKNSHKINQMRLPNPDSIRISPNKFGLRRQSAEFCVESFMIDDEDL